MWLEYDGMTGWLGSRARIGGRSHTNPSSRCHPWHLPPTKRRNALVPRLSIQNDMRQVKITRKPSLKSLRCVELLTIVARVTLMSIELSLFSNCHDTIRWWVAEETLIDRTWRFETVGWDWEDRLIRLSRWLFESKAMRLFVETEIVESGWDVDWSNHRWRDCLLRLRSLNRVETLIDRNGSDETVWWCDVDRDDDALMTGSIETWWRCDVDWSETGMMRRWRWLRWSDQMLNDEF